jgi:hypothetical protein
MEAVPVTLFKGLDGFIGPVNVKSQPTVKVEPYIQMTDI